MGKTNFTKVEEILSKGLEKIAVNELLVEADEASGKAAKSRDLVKRKELAQRIRALLIRYQSREKNIYKKLKIDKERIERQLGEVETLSAEEWPEVEAAHQVLEGYKEKFEKKFPPEDDEALVEREKVKHINKRFNVRDKWLPLH